MTIKEAAKLKEEYIKILVGRQYDARRPDWAIKDLIVSDKENAGNVYSKMYTDSISNEKALSFFSIKEDNYDVWIIAHPWPRGNGEIEIENVQNYVSANAV